MVHCPQVIATHFPQAVHMSYPLPVDARCGKPCGEPGDERGMSGGQHGITPPTSTPPPAGSTLTAHPVCTKKGCDLGKHRSPQRPQPLLLLRSYSSVNPKNK